MEGNQYLSIKHAASLIDVSHWTICKWIQERRIPFSRFGRAIRIHVDDLVGFAERIESVDELIK
jgi:excisionase family DNA binding protein